MASPFPQITSPPQASAEVLVNEMGETLEHAAVYGKKQSTTTALTWGYYGGRWGGFAVVDGTFTLTDAATNYIVVEIATGISTCATTTTNWNDAVNYARVYKLTTAGGVVTAVEDHRAGPRGVNAGGAATAGVTHSGGNLTANAVVLGAGSGDTAVVAGITTDGVSALNLGVAGASVGEVNLANATSGTLTLQPPTGALGTVVVTIPAATDTLANLAGAQPFTNKTYNGNTLTAGTFTITGAAGKTLAFDNSVTFVGVDATTMTLPGVSASLGYINIPQNSQSTDYTTVLADQGMHILHPAADTTARTWTIDSNANVAYPIGTAITFVNQHGAGTLTISITSDTMRLAGAGTTGSRTLAADGVATALKVTPTEWIISGTGLT